MARIGFLSHSDTSLHLFRRPIMQALKDAGHEVFAIAPKGDYTDEVAADFHLVAYELDRVSLNPLKVITDTNSLAQTLEILNLDLLQTSAHKSNVFGTFAAKKAGIKHVINLVEGLGSFYIDNDLKTRLVRHAIERLYKMSLKRSDGCVFVNDADPEYFLSHKLIKEDKIYKIKSVGVDTHKFDPNVINATKISDKKIVLMIARAIWHKGVREFYKAAEILKDRNDCEFVYVGGLDDNKSAANLEFLQSGNVRYLGPRNDIAELLKACYVFVLPSYKEGFPRTILEAMSMGKAVVTTDVQGCNEAVSACVNGLLCRVADGANLAEKIECLLDDEPLCVRLGQNGRDMAVKEFDERDIAQKYIEIYRKFIDV
ncbi:glycosyltransferase family 4 protein [Campylobacter sp. faydin G-105]|uniref:glycosyltransferase family 4 protein n=1 Tax=Campylobacter anatolicus TaxID=2829105 RepID=UPI001B9DB986|nr:glycosyltransferase family 4 protein [Campylobacter anatolicus]MBR8461707.1 glycosyltransferase family 4 protein [Campylobacter anatolicus]